MLRLNPDNAPPLPDDWRDQLAAAGVPTPRLGAAPTTAPYEESLAVAVLDTRGKRLWCAPTAVWDRLAPLTADDLADAARTGRALEDRHAGGLIAVATATEQQRWTLPAKARQTLERTPEAAFLAVASLPLAMPMPLSRACAALDLTPGQTAVVLTLLRVGDLKAASIALGLSHASAREAMMLALRRSGCQSRTQLIAEIFALAFGMPPDLASAKDWLMAQWEMSPREAALALAIAGGADRRDAARLVGVSDAVAKKALEAVFNRLNVRSAAELSVKLSQLAALQALRTCGADPNAQILVDASPLRVVRRRRAEARIAFSDHGPRWGRPVLYGHPSTSGRALPRVLVKALQARGFRPIAIDRPGFGLTALDPADGDPFEQAALDALDVLDHLRIDGFDLLCRGGTALAFALSRIAPTRLGAVALVSPELQTEDSGQAKGVWRLLKAVLANPTWRDAACEHLLRVGREQRFAHLVHLLFRASPPDLQTFQDPRNLSDLRASYAPLLARGVEGVVREQAARATWSSATLTPPAHWRVLIGQEDPLIAGAAAAAFWRARLGSDSVRLLAEGGRHLTFSHPEVVAEVLRSASNERRADGR